MKRLRMASVILALLMVASLLPLQVFAEGDQKVVITHASGYNVRQGESIFVEIKARSTTTDPYKIDLETDEGISIESGLSGVISSTEQVKINYYIKADEKASRGTHFITVKATDADGNKLLQESRLPITVNSASDGSRPASAVTYDLSGGDALYNGEVNTVTVYIYNSGKSTLKDSRVTLNLPAGLSIESGPAAMLTGTFAPGKTVSASFPVVVDKNMTSGSYPLTAVLTGEKTADGVTTQETVSETFYVIVKTDKEVEDEVETDVAHPILMVTNYSSGGTVVAGGRFPLTLTIKNTSSVDLRNIKVVVNSDGSFIPVGSSNSFYIEEIKAKSSQNFTMNFSCSKSTLDGPHSLSVSMEYEDGNKRSYSASDTISVPVAVPTTFRFVVDEILDPGYLRAGEQAYVQVNYRNMGTNQLYNLSIKVEGDFTVEGNASYYAGNMAAGRSDYYNFNFFPNEPGECRGKVIFTFEDADGHSQTVEKEFTFNIGEAMNWDDPGVIEPDFPIQPERQGLQLWHKIAIAAAAVAAVIAVAVIRKKRKAKKLEALELDE